MLKLESVCRMVNGKSWPVGEREQEVRESALKAQPFMDSKRPATIWTARLSDGSPNRIWHYGVARINDCYVATFEPCEDYTEDPEEVAPCLVCGEPKPNREACPTCQEAEKEAQA